MELKTAFIALAIATASFAAGYWYSARPWINHATAREHGRLSALFNGHRGASRINFCAPENRNLIAWSANFATRDLKLNETQQAKFDTLVKTALDSLQKSESLCTANREAIHAMPLPEQIAMVRDMAKETGEIVEEIRKPLMDFHESLDASQRAVLNAMIAEHHGGDRGDGYWHRRG